MQQTNVRNEERQLKQTRFKTRVSYLDNQGKIKCITEMFEHLYFNSPEKAKQYLLDNLPKSVSDKWLNVDLLEFENIQGTEFYFYLKSFSNKNNVLNLVRNFSM